MSETAKKEYDFVGKNPNDILTPDELTYFDDGMGPKNDSPPADSIDFARAARATARDLDKLYP